MTEQRIDLGLTSTSASTGGCGAGCGCGHASADEATATPTDSATTGATTALRVEGMTCDHCVRAVTEELSAVDGVEVVDIELHVGGASIVRISSDGTADDDRLAAAVDEAGYTLVR